MASSGPPIPHGTKGHQCRRCGDDYHREDLCPLVAKGFEEAYDAAKRRIEGSLYHLHARRRRTNDRFQELIEMEDQIHSQELLDHETSFQLRITALKDHFRMENESLKEIDKYLHIANSTESRLEQVLVRDSLLARVKQDNSAAARSVAQQMLRAFRNRQTIDGCFTIPMKGYEMNITPRDYDPNHYLGLPSNVGDPFGLSSLHQAHIRILLNAMAERVPHYDLATGQGASNAQKAEVALDGTAKNKLLEEVNSVKGSETQKKAGSSVGLGPGGGINIRHEAKKLGQWTTMHHLYREDVDPMPTSPEEVTAVHVRHFFEANIMNMFRDLFTVQSNVNGSIHVIPHDIWLMIQEVGMESPTQ